jgi:hypothetical protein
LRQGRIGAVEIFLASRDTMPISGMPGRPTTHGKNERSHQTLARFLDANRPASLEQLRTRITRFREHYNRRRPHQALTRPPRPRRGNCSHTPATEPVPLAVLEAKASEYRQARRLRHRGLAGATVTISKTGRLLPDEPDQVVQQAANQSIVEITPANRQVYYQGYHVSLPTTFAGRQFYRTITDEEFLLSDIDSGEVVFSFPLPMIALQTRGRFVSSYTIQGVQLANPTTHWGRKHAEFQAQFALRRDQVPAVFTDG